SIGIPWGDQARHSLAYPGAGETPAVPGGGYVSGAEHRMPRCEIGGGEAAMKAKGRDGGTYQRPGTALKMAP
ncbi:MAG TPA: hypothetical protein PKA37_15330, partial [Planctomycetota bacterium]|nr:hypothetical protein [Planctomycetota bacterium]